MATYFTAHDTPARAHTTQTLNRVEYQSCGLDMIKRRFQWSSKRLNGVLLEWCSREEHSRRREQLNGRHGRKCETRCVLFMFRGNILRGGIRSCLDRFRLHTHTNDILLWTSFCVCAVTACVRASRVCVWVKHQALVYDILPWRKVPESDARSVCVLCVGACHPAKPLPHPSVLSFSTDLIFSHCAIQTD